MARFRRHQANLAHDALARERRQKKAVETSLAKPCLAEKNITPIIRYRHVCCSCGHSFTAVSQEASCRNCMSYNLTVEHIPKTGARD